jgi:hypothetical protein
MRRIVRSVRLASVILAGVVAIIGLAGGARAQEIDPKYLLGEWQGQWVLASQRGLSGPFFMTIKKVEDGKVFGRVERPGARVTPADFDFVGTLAGNVLSFGSAARSEFIVDGKQMRGFMLGASRVDVELQKR